MHDVQIVGMATLAVQLEAEILARTIQPRADGFLQWQLIPVAPVRRNIVHRDRLRGEKVALVRIDQLVHVYRDRRPATTMLLLLMLFLLLLLMFVAALAPGV